MSESPGPDVRQPLSGCLELPDLEGLKRPFFGIPAGFEQARNGPHGVERIGTGYNDRVGERSVGRRSIH